MGKRMVQQNEPEPEARLGQPSYSIFCLVDNLTPLQTHAKTSQHPKKNRVTQPSTNI